MNKQNDKSIAQSSLTWCSLSYSKIRDAYIKSRGTNQEVNSVKGRGNLLSSKSRCSWNTRSLSLSLCVCSLEYTITLSLIDLSFFDVNASNLESDYRNVHTLGTRQRRKQMKDFPINIDIETMLDEENKTWWQIVSGDISRQKAFLCQVDV